MGFTVGETVVYPHHGAALIEAIEKRVIKGEEKAYLVLKVAQGDLTAEVADLGREYETLREDFNAAVGALRQTIASIAETSHVVRDSAADISGATNNALRPVASKAPAAVCIRGTRNRKTP